MDIKDFLLTSLSRKHIDHAADWAIDKHENFEELYQLIYDDNKKLAWRATWVVEKIHMQYPDLVIHKLNEIIKNLSSFKNDGSKRSSLLIILRSPVPEPIPVELVNTCFDWMMSPKESIAVQVNCMKILDKICRVEPDLRQELELCLTGDISEYGIGFRTSARKILKQSAK